MKPLKIITVVKTTDLIASIVEDTELRSTSCTQIYIAISLVLCLVLDSLLETVDECCVDLMSEHFRADLPYCVCCVCEQ